MRLANRFPECRAGDSRRPRRCYTTHRDTIEHYPSHNQGEPVLGTICLGLMAPFLAYATFATVPGRPVSLWSVKFGAPGPLRSFRPHPNTFPLPPDASVFLDIFPLVYSVQRVCGFRAPGCFRWFRPRTQNLPIASGSLLCRRMPFEAFLIGTEVCSTTLPSNPCWTC